MRISESYEKDKLMLIFFVFSVNFLCYNGGGNILHREEEATYGICSGNAEYHKGLSGDQGE